MEIIRQIMIRVDNQGRKQLSQANSLVAYLSDRMFSLVKIVEKDIGSDIRIDIQHDENNKKFEYIYSINFNFGIEFKYDKKEVIDAVYSVLKNVLLIAKKQEECLAIESVYNNSMNTINGFNSHIERELIIFRLEKQVHLILKKLSKTTLCVELYRLWHHEKIELKIENKNKKDLNEKKQISFFDAEFEENKNQNINSNKIELDDEQLVEELIASSYIKKVKSSFSLGMKVNNNEVEADYHGNNYEKLIKMTNNILKNRLRIVVKIKPDGSTLEIIELHPNENL